MFSFVSLLLPPAQEEVRQKTQCLAQEHECTLNRWVFKRQLLTSAALPDRCDVLHASSVVSRVEQETGQDQTLSARSDSMILYHCCHCKRGSDSEALVAGRSDLPDTWLRWCLSSQLAACRL